MNFATPKTSLSLAAIAGLVAGTACAGGTSRMEAVDETSTSRMEAAEAQHTRDVREVLRSWPQKSAEVARSAMEAYGSPDEVTESMLIWHDSGPWKMTIAHRDPVQHDFPMPHPDLLEQFIDYDVPPEMFDDLANYDGSVHVERTKGVMAARCDKIGANFLAINLAHDIVAGERSVESARSLYADAIKAFMDSGEMHEYMKGFQFQLPRGDTGDPDRNVLGANGPNGGPSDQR